jgi:hypothetical protein
MAVDPLLALASSVFASPETFALLVGSGISRAAQVPTGWEVALDLVRRYALLRDGRPPDDPAHWYRELTGGDPDYSKVLESLAVTPAERRDLLQAYFEPTADERDQGIKTPTAAHRAIAELVSGGYLRVIVTTNFDRLLESALAEAGVQPVVISSAAAAEGSTPLAHSRCTVVKVHGDYLNPDLRNTVEELMTYDEALNRLLDEVFDQYGLIVCGWSGEWDHALRAALLRAKGRRYSTYWCALRPPSGVAGNLVAHREAVVVPIESADALFVQLASKVMTLAEATDQRPMSTAMAVAELKRYLPDPLHRIRLHDLLIGEAQETLQGLSRFEAENAPPPNPDGVRDRLHDYERASATLLSLLVTGGYLGDEARHDALWTEVIRRLTHRRMQRGGYTVWVDMQLYPSLLATYALGLGGLAAHRPDALALSLGSIVVRRPNGDLPLAVGTSNWRVLDYDFVKPFVGEGNRKTPISDYLHERLRQFVRDVVPDDDAYDQLFDELEYLFAVLYAHYGGEGRGPVGRYVWKGRGEGFIPDQALLRHADLWLSAGLFSGVGEELTTTKDAYDAHLGGSSLRF